MAAPAAAIAGIHEFEKRTAGGLSPLQIKAECAARALDNAGLSWADVDAVYDASEAGRMQGLTIAEYFGVTPRVLDTTNVSPGRTGRLNRPDIEPNRAGSDPHSVCSSARPVIP